MKVLCLLLVLVGFSNAGHGPVYRQAPPLVGAKSWEMNPPAQNPTTPKAEERQESQAYMTDVGGKTTVLSSPGVSTLSGSGTNSVLQNAVLPTVSTSGMTKGLPESQYKVYMFHGANPSTSYSQFSPQALDSNSYPMTYQQQSPGVMAPALNNFWKNIKWMDVLVGTSSLALVGLGSAMAYPYLRSAFGVRMMRELADMNREDAARMAKSVMTAFQKLSEMNNQSKVADGPAESEE